MRRVKGDLIEKRRQQAGLTRERLIARAQEDCDVALNYRCYERMVNTGKLPKREGDLFLAALSAILKCPASDLVENVEDEQAA